MAIGASILRGEMRRHLLMNVTLVASSIVGATVVTNERGLFVPITLDDSDTARAFAAMFTQSRLLPEEITHVDMVTPLAPFEVLADSRDLRRRLMDAISTDNAGALPEFQKNASSVPQLDQQVLRIGDPGQQVAAANTVNPATPAAAAANTAGNTTTAANNTNANQGGQQPLTVANNNNTAAQQTASGVGTDVVAGPSAVPEPTIWATLIAGFGMIGSMLRATRRRERKEAERGAAA